MFYLLQLLKNQNTEMQIKRACFTSELLLPSSASLIPEETEIGRFRWECSALKLNPLRT